MLLIDHGQVLIALLSRRKTSRARALQSRVYWFTSLSVSATLNDSGRTFPSFRLLQIVLSLIPTRDQARETIIDKQEVSQTPSTLYTWIFFYK